MISSKPPLSKQKNYNLISGINNINPLIFQQNLYANIYNNKNYYMNSSGLTDGKSSTDADSLTFKNCSFEQSKDAEIHINLKSPNEFIKELFKIYSEQNCLSNYLLFEKNIDINFNVEKMKLKNITLSEYFDIFKEAGFLCLDIPFIEKRGNIIYNIFNPTLSSMVLLIKSKKVIEESINKKYMKENFTAYSLPDDYIKVEFDETNPPYNRDIIDSKIKIVHKMIGQKKIKLDKIDKDKSYFCILWTPADTYKINTSFLSYYTFDFKLIGILIIKRNDYNWFSSFSIGNNNIKDFKTDYLNKVNKVENFLKKCYQINGDNNIERKFYSYDYKRYIYNS